VWDVELPPAEKLVLLSLADNASDDGHCFPSVPTIVRRTGLSRRSVQRVITALTDRGHLSVQERHGRSSTYRLHPRHGDAPTGVTMTPHPCQPDAPTCVTMTPLGASPWRERGVTMTRGGRHHDAHNSHRTVREPQRRKERAGARKTFFDATTIQGLDQDAWTAWVAHRAGMKKPIPPDAMADAARELAALGDRQRAEVKRAHANGWQSLHAQHVANGADNTAHESKQLKAWRARKEALKNA